jgi:hypothetical protein
MWIRKIIKDKHNIQSSIILDVSKRIIIQDYIIISSNTSEGIQVV